MLINKTDIKKYYPFTDNIADANINPHIRDAEDIDLVPLFSDSLITAIQAATIPAVLSWNRNTTYAIGNVVLWQDAYYKATAISTNSEPPSGNWEDCELLNYWNEYIKPLMCAYTIKRFTLWTGANYTQFGIRQNNDETSTEVSGQRRAELLADLNNKVNYYQMKALKRLASVRNTLDGVVYSLDSDDICNPRPSFVISVPSFRRFPNSINNNCDNYDHFC
jgi:hypothetical protein